MPLGASAAAHLALAGLLLAAGIRMLPLAPPATGIVTLMIASAPDAAPPGSVAPSPLPPDPAPPDPVPAEPAPPMPEPPAAAPPDPPSPAAEAEALPLPPPPPPAPPADLPVARPDPPPPRPAAASSPARMVSTPAPAALAPAALPGPPAPSSAEVGSWQQALLTWLDRHQTYPPVARRRGVQGVVTLRFLLDSMGRVAEVTLVETSGVAELDAAALDLLRGATLPAPPPGTPEAARRVTVPLRYRLAPR